MILWKKKKTEQQPQENMAQKIKYLGYEMSVTSSQISSVAKSLFLNLKDQRNFTHELLGRTQEVTALHMETSQQLDDTIQVIEQVNQRLQEVDTATDQLEAANERSSLQISHNKAVMEGVSDCMMEIEETSKMTRRAIQELNEAAKQIIPLLESVDHISKQTHLLALNASIESARAGEAGRGFGVVAEQIRLLSGDTAKAVKDVSSLIDAIQGKLEQVNLYMKQNDEKVLEGSKQTGDIKVGLEQMAMSFVEVDKRIDQIQELSVHQKEMTFQMNEKIEKVRILADHTKTSIETVLQDSETQKEQIVEIEQVGGQLKDWSEDLSHLIVSMKLNDLSDIDVSKITAHEQLFKEIIDKLCMQESFCSLNKEAHLKALEEVKEQYSFIEAIWTNRINGKFIVSLPQAAISNGEIRQWFQAAASGSTYISKPYISAITKRPCVTLSAPIINHGRINGVIGVDVKLE